MGNIRLIAGNNRFPFLVVGAKKEPAMIALKEEADHGLEKVCV